MGEGAGMLGREKAAADLWKHTLSQIHTIFGRLAYLSSLRDGNTGVYQHHGLSMTSGQETAGRTLADSHLDCFRVWLAMPLREQLDDLREYFSQQEAELKVIVGAWERLGSYRNLIPAGAAAAERQLFLADLESLLAALRNECGAGRSDPSE